MSTGQPPRVMLILPPLVTAEDEGFPLNTQPPLGLAYVAAYLKKYGVIVSVVDAFTELDGASGTSAKYHGLSPEGIKRRIVDFSPDIIGISSMYTMYNQGAHSVAAFAKEVNKDIIVVCGGTHASVNPQMVLADENIDFVVHGEGEVTFLELVNAYQNSQDIRAITGIIHRLGGKIITNPPRPLIKNLDDLPAPARELLPMRVYFDNIPKTKNYNMRHLSTTVSTSRGCPQDCIYCAVKNVWGRVWRARSPENVVDEIESLVKDYGVREFQFSDDSISVDVRRLRAICEEIIRRKIDIKWTTPAGIAIWHLDKSLLKLMKKSGCYRLTFGLESGNAQTLKFIGKNYTYEHARSIIRYAGKLGIWTAGTFIIGFPHETKAMIAQTCSFALNSGLDFVVFYTPVIFPGTPLFDEFVSAGIKYNPRMTGTNRAYDTKYVTEKELFAIRQQTSKSFLRRRALQFVKSAQKVRNIEDLLYFIKLITNIAHSYIASACDKKSAFGLLRSSQVHQ